jgi:hypothetical protein
MTKFRAGDLVEVRSREEILGTLDKNGQLEGLPFMPQMLQYCGKRYRVYKRAHKTCDTINPIAGRRLADGIHLNLRCDGKAYGGCQAACLIFWKAPWLKPVGAGEVSVNSSPQNTPWAEDQRPADRNRCTEADVLRATSAVDPHANDGKRYFCQATELPRYTTPLPWWNLNQYAEDYASGNVTLGRIMSGLGYACYYWVGLCGRGRSGVPARWLYDRFQALWGGVPFPRKHGQIPVGQLTPTATLDLQPGEWVRVKSYEEILATLDKESRNRGLSFDAEQVPYCGGRYRVRARVQKFLNEKTGRMAEMKTPAVILEDVWCGSRYSSCRMNCPRSIYSWWRENWLERVEPSTRSQIQTLERTASTSHEERGRAMTMARDGARIYGS